MAKSKTMYVCDQCGYETAKWLGKCPSCGEWNTLGEITIPANGLVQTASALSPSAAVKEPVKLSAIDTADDPRYTTGMSEFDRVLGGGIVKGSMILLGGDPGIGKSTLLLQICQTLGGTMRVLYVSGEESARQLKLRAVRLSVSTDNLLVLTETDCGTVIESIRRTNPDLVIIDSIQTMNISELTSSPGSIVQVRECTNAIMRVIKAMEIPTFLVSHVNKDGAIAGPKVLEHVVDAVLYFEGERNMSYRILRAVKNRYGSTNEIGVFDMHGDGLHVVENPSLMLLSGRPRNVAGTCVACIMEGSRPLLAEVQGLAASSSLSNPRRMSTGFDYNRMSLIIAVLEKRCGYYFSSMDAYVKVIGGLRLDEPAADLPVALSLISSLKDSAISEGVVAFGEIGLVGELRAVSNVESRVREAARLGMTQCILPKHNARTLQKQGDFGIELIGVGNVREAAEVLWG